MDAGTSTLVVQLLAVFLVLPSWMGFFLMSGHWLNQNVVHPSIVGARGQAYLDRNSQAIGSWDVFDMVRYWATWPRFAAYVGPAAIYAYVVTSAPPAVVVSLIGVGLVCAVIWGWLLFTRRPGRGV